MKIAVAFFGLPRCSEKSFPSIEQNLLEKLPAEAEVKCFYHFYHQSEVVNPHSGENGKFDESNYKPFEAYQGIFETPVQVLPELPYEELKEFGDAWKDNFNSFKNQLLQLHSLKKVTALLEPFDPDCVLFARPDLVYHDAIPAYYYRICRYLKDSVFLPEWQWGIGVNDRFAIVEKGAYQVYGTRITEAINYCREANGPLHAERLLKYTLLKNKKRIFILKAKASRVRINGEFAKENFAPKVSFFSPLDNPHKRFLILTQIKTKVKLGWLKSRFE